jgi:protein-tyrosine kinase
MNRDEGVAARAAPELGEVAVSEPFECRLPQPIGSILSGAAKLSPKDVERIVALQRRKGVRFGEAARALGLVSRADVERALARQFDLSYIQRGESTVSRAVVAAYEASSPQVEALRAARDQLVLRWLDQEAAPRTLAILSAARREGRSFIAANLAVVFAQLGHSTLLVDADLRSPSQHRFFGLDNRIGLSAVLAGRADFRKAVQHVPSLPGLSVLPAGAIPPNPQDLLLRPAFAELLQELGGHASLVLIDCPPANTSDAQTIAVRAGAALVVVRKHASRVWRVQGISSSVGEAKARIIGAVLNEF